MTKRRRSAERLVGWQVGRVSLRGASGQARRRTASPRLGSRRRRREVEDVIAEPHMYLLSTTRRRSLRGGPAAAGRVHPTPVPPSNRLPRYGCPPASAPRLLARPWKSTLSGRA